MQDRPVVCEDVDDLLTTEELVLGFKVTKITVEKWRKKKGLPHVRIRGHRQDSIRFRLSEVQKWAAKNDRKFRRPSRRS